MDREKQKKNQKSMLLTLFLPNRFLGFASFSSAFSRSFSRSFANRSRSRFAFVVGERVRKKDECSRLLGELEPAVVVDVVSVPVDDDEVATDRFVDVDLRGVAGPDGPRVELTAPDPTRDPAAV